MIMLGSIMGRGWLGAAGNSFASPALGAALEFDAVNVGFFASGGCIKINRKQLISIKVRGGIIKALWPLRRVKVLQDS